MMFFRCFQPDAATLLDIPGCSIKKEDMLHRWEMCISENRPKEEDASSSLSTCCYYCRAIATLLDIPACSIKKEEMFHRLEMCISKNREEMLLGSGKKLFL
jgi:hypothetical protein